MALSVHLVNLFKTLLILAGMAFAAAYLVYQKNPTSLSSESGSFSLSKVFSLESLKPMVSKTKKEESLENASELDSLPPAAARASMDIDWSILYEGGPTQRSKIAAAIKEASDTYEIDPGLIRALIMMESMFDPVAVSPKGAKGLMQLMPETATELGVRDIFNPRENVLAGSLYLSTQIKNFGGDLRLALAAYHAGPERVRREGYTVPWESQEYVSMVLIYSRFFGYNKQ